MTHQHETTGTGANAGAPSSSNLGTPAFARPLCERDASKCLTMCPHACVENCPVDAFSVLHGSVVYNQEKCVGCGICVGKCPGGALSIGGRTNSNALQRENSSPEDRASLRKQIRARRKAGRQ